MSGQIVLAGGAEFQRGFEPADKEALILAGGAAAPVVILPTANMKHPDWAGREGVNWFERMGATNVEALPITNTNSANDPALAHKVASAKLIYMAGGDPAYLLNSLRGSACWKAARQAFEAGAVVGGSSAGAMACCQFMYNPNISSVLPGLNLVPNTIVIPHFSSGSKSWVSTIEKSQPGVIILGIDEHTAIIGRAATWHVYGQGAATVYQQGQPTVYNHGETISLA